MLQHFPEKCNERSPDFQPGAVRIFLTSKPKLWKKVYFQTKKAGQRRF